MELPIGYKQLEYIKSTGTQYINTGYSPKSDNVVYECEWIEDTLQVANTLFGSTNINSSASRWSAAHYHPSAGKIYIALAGSDGVLTTSGIVAGAKNYLITTINNGSLRFEMNGKSATATYGGSIQNGINIGIFADIRNTDVIEKCAMKLIRWKMYDNGALVRDFVPCKNTSGVIGLYDLANGKFYANAGSGNFEAGPEVITDKGILFFKGVKHVEIPEGKVVKVTRKSDGAVLWEGTTEPEETPTETFNIIIGFPVYTVEKGATWGEWVNSKYSTHTSYGWTHQITSDSRIYCPNLSEYVVYANGTYVKQNEVIQEGTSYNYQA